MKFIKQENEKDGWFDNNLYYFDKVSSVSDIQELIRLVSKNSPVEELSIEYDYDHTEEKKCFTYDYNTAIHNLEISDFNDILNISFCEIVSGEKYYCTIYPHSALVEISKPLKKNRVVENQKKDLEKLKFDYLKMTALLRELYLTADPVTKKNIDSFNSGVPEKWNDEDKSRYIEIRKVENNIDNIKLDLMKSGISSEDYYELLTSNDKSL